MKNPKVSVIMPVYNGMPFLKEAVKSILNQTYKNFEFVIVDDDSKDETNPYLKNLKNNKVILIKNKKNLGVAASLNIALKRSSGDYIARMDADDVSLPNRLEEQVKFLQKNPSIDLCGTWADIINEKGQKIGEKKYPTDPERVKTAITWYTAVMHPTYMAKKSFYKELRGYRKDFDYAEDYDLLARAKNKYKIANIPKKLLLWRFQDNRRSRKGMQTMDNVDLKIKLESIQREGITISGVLAVGNKIAMTYLLPPSLKNKLAQILKLA